MKFAIAVILIFQLVLLGLISDTVKTNNNYLKHIKKQNEESRKINDMKEEKNYEVNVSIEGERILTLAPTYLSGVDLTDEHERIIEDCAHMLLSFIGKKSCDNDLDELPF